MPRCFWSKTRKGRGYGVYDNKSHGVPHKPNHELFWETKRHFAEKYNVTFTNFGQPRPESDEAFREQSAANVDAAFRILREDQDYIDWMANRLLELGESGPAKLAGFKWDPSKHPGNDPEILNWKEYPDHIGHKITKGCFRCHGEHHASDDGRTLHHSCNECHSIIAQGPGTELPSITSGGLEFEHPEDIGDEWKETPCSDCHEGVPVG